MTPPRALPYGAGPAARLVQDPRVARGGEPRFLPHGGRPGDERAKAERTAAQFEELFVRSMVSSLRSTATLDGGGMFGSGPGSDTFADWFDQNLAQQISRSTRVGIKEQLLADLERHQEIPGSELAAKAHAARAAADRTSLYTRRPVGAGGIDVVSR
jgi:Rod binding domain-containing protein